MTTAHLPGQPATPLRARSLGDLIHVIPSLLGFHPVESMVVVLIDRAQVVVTGRVDLTAIGAPADADDCFAALWERFPGTACCAVAYSADASAAWAGLADLEASLPGGTLIAVAHVDNGRWHAAPHDGGLPYDPTSSALAAEAAYRGVRVLPGRAALESTLDATWPPAVMDHALEAVIAVPPALAVTRALTLLAEVMPAPRLLSPSEAALLAVAAYSPTFADVAVADLRSEASDEARQVWTCVVRSTTERVGACAAVILGLASWIGGDGALANVVLARAEPFASGFFWYQFLESVMASALPPDRWEGIRKETLAAL